jgi:hypothetical protein
MWRLGGFVILGMLVTLAGTSFQLPAGRFVIIADEPEGATFVPNRIGVEFVIELAGLLVDGALFVTGASPTPRMIIGSAADAAVMVTITPAKAKTFIISSVFALRYSQEVRQHNRKAKQESDQPSAVSLDIRQVCRLRLAG